MKQPQIYAFADEASPIIDKQIIAMQRNGLQGLEIRNVDGESVAAISLEKAHEVRGKMDAAGLKVWSIGSPISRRGAVPSGRRSSGTGRINESETTKGRYENG